MFAQDVYVFFFLLTFSLNWGSENGSSEAVDVGLDNGDLKRKQSDMDSEPQHPNKSPKNGHGVESSPSTSKSSKQQSKREKLDWKVLRPPKSKR